MRAVVVCVLLWLLSLGSTTTAFSLRIFNSQEVIQTLWHAPFKKLPSIFAQIIDHYRAQQSRLFKVAECEYFLVHCRHLHNFFKHCCVDTKHHGLIYSEYDMFQDANDGSIMPLVAYWQSQRFVALYHFYALYYDCVARLFVLAIYESGVHLKKKEYAQFRTRAEQYYAELALINKMLVASEYEERYSRQLARYDQLLNFVHNEKYAST